MKRSHTDLKSNLMLHYFPGSITIWIQIPSKQQICFCERKLISFLIAYSLQFFQVIYAMVGCRPGHIVRSKVGFFKHLSNTQLITII